MLKIKYLISLTVLFISLSGSSYAQQTVRLAVGEWEPYVSQNLPQKGLIARIITEAFALEGVKVELGFFPWARAKALAKQYFAWIPRYDDPPRVTVRDALPTQARPVTLKEKNGHLEKNTGDIGLYNSGEASPYNGLNLTGSGALR